MTNVFITDVFKYQVKSLSILQAKFDPNKHEAFITRRQARQRKPGNSHRCQKVGL